ncbi:hypothetical protein P3G55_22650 [Leptospira sp. 96542]|nr:hypothetical protein [Leptospira sp. 96542]
MWSTAPLKRFIYLFHRWSGVGFCLLMLLWVVSGVVMLYVGYPRLLPQERLAALPALATEGCCVPVAAALAHSSDAAQVQELRLTSIGGAMRYRLREGDGSLLLVDAVTGRRLPPADEVAALASAQAFLPGVPAQLLDTVEDDRWSHSRLMDPHRPLYRVQMEDEARTLLYVSSVTGEVMLDAPQTQRAWNFVGAWLHWLYMFRDNSRDPFWTWLLILLSAAGTLSVLAGAAAGLWRWRFQGRYKTGRGTPYREAPMRWHHLSGLVFGLMLIVWMFSGLMSMNPLGLFDPAQGRPDLAAYRGGTPGTTRPELSASQALALLRRSGFEPRELEWKVLGGQPYFLARGAHEDSRIVLRQAQGWSVHAQWSDDVLLAAAAQLRPEAITNVDVLRGYDSHYYARQAASMYGGNERPLPVLKVVYADTGRTQAYLDPRSGDVVHSADRAQRTGRWLFNLLHSWDLPVMLHGATAREVTLILLSLGMLAVAATGSWIGWKRLRVFVHQSRLRARGKP